jgi:hypothetical protein
MSHGSPTTLPPTPTSACEKPKRYADSMLVDDVVDVASFDVIAEP